MMKHTPLRMCIACRQMKPQNELIRIVKDKATHNISLDTEKKLFGRGAYVCRNADCIKSAEKKRGIERHFKCAVPHEIYESIVKLID